MDGEGSEPTYVLQRREALTPVFDDLNRYEVTTHFNGQCTVTLDGDRATGESYTIAHHVYTEDGDRKIMIASLRYLDTFTKIEGRWYFAERKLILDWSETRSMTAPPAGSAACAAARWTRSDPVRPARRPREDGRRADPGSVDAPGTRAFG